MSTAVAVNCQLQSHFKITILERTIVAITAVRCSKCRNNSAAECAQIALMPNDAVHNTVSLLTHTTQHKLTCFSGRLER